MTTHGSAANILWLLDTCVLSELSKASPEPHVVSWMQRNAGRSAFPAVAAGEIQHGLLRMSAGAKRRQLNGWFDGLCEQFHGRILSTDLAVWREFGRIKAELEDAGKPQEDLDVLIAATAHCHGLTLVTRNTKHFANTGLALLNPWVEAASTSGH